MRKVDREIQKKIEEVKSKLEKLPTKYKKPRNLNPLNDY